jgi:hypothetical protein
VSTTLVASASARKDRLLKSSRKIRFITKSKSTTFPTLSMMISSAGKSAKTSFMSIPSTHEKVVRQDDINFYKKQKRISLHGCSLINPDYLEESLGYDGFKALKKVL